MSESKDVEGLVTQVYKRRERQMYPEVAQYLRTFRQAQRDYDDAIAKAEYDYRLRERVAMRAAEDNGEVWDTYGAHADTHSNNRRQREREYNAAQAALRTGRDAVLTPLLASSHREVAWIARTILQGQADNGEQTEYARDILAILPATTEEIWAEAKDNRGMCDVFDRYYDQAEAAGVFSIDGSAATAAREIAALRSYIRRNYGGSYVSTFMEKLNPILKAYQADADKRLEDARAEWQGLDEAWRSERSRRGAATRRANAEAATNEAPEPTPAQADPFEDQPAKVAGQGEYTVLTSA